LPALPAEPPVELLSPEPPAASSPSPEVLPPQPVATAKPSESERERRDARRRPENNGTKKAINTPPEQGTLENDERSWNTFL
jgi:hypothetical protein